MSIYYEFSKLFNWCFFVIISQMYSNFCSKNWFRVNRPFFYSQHFIKHMLALNRKAVRKKLQSLRKEKNISLTLVRKVGALMHCPKQMSHNSVQHYVQINKALLMMALKLKTEALFRDTVFYPAYMHRQLQSRTDSSRACVWGVWICSFRIRIRMSFIARYLYTYREFVFMTEATEWQWQNKNTKKINK